MSTNRCSCTRRAHARPLAVKPETCFGVAKAGQNDCSTANHSCNGQASVDKRTGRLQVCSQRHLRKGRRKVIGKLMRWPTEPFAIFGTSGKDGEVAREGAATRPGTHVISIEFGRMKNEWQFCDVP